MLSEPEAAPSRKTPNAAIFRMVSGWCFLAIAFWLHPFSSAYVSSGEPYLLRRSPTALIMLICSLGASLLFSVNASRHSFGFTKASSIVCLVVVLLLLGDWFILLISWPARRWG